MISKKLVIQQEFDFDGMSFDDFRDFYCAIREHEPRVKVIIDVIDRRKGALRAEVEEAGNLA